MIIGPHQTPKCVKTIIWITVVASLLCPILNYFFIKILHISSPSLWLALSHFGLAKGWFWQPLTYPFIHSVGIGLSLSFLISLFFHMFICWFAGSELAFRYGARSFWLFYLTSTLVAGIAAAALLMTLSPLSILVGSGPPIFALLTIWAMLYPELELYFLFIIRLKAKWLVLLILALALFINLSYGEWLSFVGDLTAILFAFGVGRVVWKLPNPYPIQRRVKRRHEDKIIDITHLQDEKEDAFMDEMLEKIARQGKESLSSREQKKMEEISRRRTKRGK